jgi:hypothetical protein
MEKKGKRALPTGKMLDMPAPRGGGIVREGCRKREFDVVVRRWILIGIFVPPGFLSGFWGPVTSRVVD